MNVKIKPNDQLALIIRHSPNNAVWTSSTFSIALFGLNSKINIHKTLELFKSTRTMHIIHLCPSGCSHNIERRYKKCTMRLKKQERV